uniref:Uncharacterized protein n=1 Tax=Panagrolaimus sp. JU765 TaxID=591449 RepID=A0AC34RE82_9BILA
MKNYHGSFYHLTSMVDTRSLSFQEEFSFYFEEFYPEDEALVFIRIKELDVENCLFDHNIIDFLTNNLEHLLHFTMVNNGTGFCKTTMFNIGYYYKFVVGMELIWTNSKENVLLLNSRHELVVKFNYITVNYFEYVEFNDLLFELYLPPHASVTMSAFLVL